MIQSAARGKKASQDEAGSDQPSEDLPYIVELWNDAGTKVLRALAKAHNLSLAHVIFKAASGEHPDRRLTLRRDGRILASSTEAQDTGQ